MSAAKKTTKKKAQPATPRRNDSEKWLTIRVDRQDMADAREALAEYARNNESALLLPDDIAGLSAAQVFVRMVRILNAPAATV